ncbi:MAG: short-chain fatty acid transporter [Spirochaetota bacterium]
METKTSFFAKLTEASTKFVERVLPNAFVFAALLTPVVFLSGIIFTKQAPMSMVIHWYDGFWSLLTFAMQMALIVVTGHALALSPIFKRGLRAMASIPRTPTQGILIVTVVSAIACWINWGFGLVIGALYAREIAKRIRGIDYRLLIASAYSGFIVWHAGLSGSIPLKIATGDKDLSRLSGGVFTEAVPIAETIFAPFSYVPALVLMATLPILNVFMQPSKDKIIAVSPDVLKEDDVEPPQKADTLAKKLDNSWLISYALGLMGLAYIIHYFSQKGFSLNLNILIFVFFTLGLLFHKTPIRFVAAVRQAIKGTAGVVVQFPLYAGIMGMMEGVGPEGFSLASLMTSFFSSVSSAETLPFFSFLAAGILNFFVPSGGGHWVIQGPILMPAAAELGASTTKTAMAIAWGDAWTNLVQPFWALPALGIAGLGARDIMGFCLIAMLYGGLIISLALFIF